MQCPECNSDTPSGTKFCGQCGSRLPLSCPECAAEVAPDSKFCGQCGAALTSLQRAARGVNESEPPRPEAPPSPDATRENLPESEIKQVTVLSGELIVGHGDGALPSSQAVEAEVMHALLSRFIKLAQKEVQRFDGTIAQLLGQGFIALFGAPITHEDHPRRAVFTALQLSRRLSDGQFNIPGTDTLPIQLRLGIGTGTAVIGGSAGAAVGPAADRARSLMEVAPVGSTLVSDETAKLVQQQVKLEAFAPAEGAAGAPREPAWRLVGSLSLFSSPSSGRRLPVAPLIGRSREMDVLDDLREQAEAGHGQVAGIVGEAGSGKSRLLLEVSKAIRGKAISHLRGHCLSYTAGIPYFPFIDMIRRASRIEEGDPASVVAEKIRRSLSAVGLDAEENLPWFLHLLGTRDDSQEAEPANPRTLQAQTFAAMRRMVLSASRHSLVVMEIEDLHWMDETSEEFLASLVEEVGGSRILLLLTYRAGYQPRWLQKSYATQIVMRRLSLAQSKAVAQSAVQDHAADPVVVANIVERAGGNPFFLEELVRSLIEDSAQGPVPGTVQGVLMARIDRLPEAHKHLLQIASVLGREPQVELLERVWDRTDEVAPLLDDLLRWEFLYRTAANELEAYSFKHVLTQEVAYDSLLKSRRRDLHAQAASALEELYADRLEDAYDRLIYHYPRAGEPQKTVQYLTLFAARAAGNYSHAEAAKALSEALIHAHQLPAGERGARTLDLLLRLAESYLPLARFPETLKSFEQHRDLLEEVQDRSLLARFHFWLAHTHTYLGNAEKAQDHAELSMEAAREAGDEATEGKACYVLGRDAFWGGRVAQGLEHSLRSVVLLERTGQSWWQGQAYWVAGFHHFASGNFSQGLEAFHRACAIGEALDDYRLDASWSIGYLLACQGQAEEAIEFCKRGLELSKDPLNTAVSMGFLGFAYLEAGDAQASVKVLREAGTRLGGTGMRQIVAWFTVFLSEAYLALDRLERAFEAGREGLAISQEVGFAYGAGLALRTLGRIEIQRSHYDEAEQYLREALLAFEGLEMPFESARAQLDQASFLLATGSSDQAQAVLREASNGFARLHLTQLENRVTEVAEGLRVEAS